MQRLKNRKKEIHHTRDYWEDPQNHFAEWVSARDWARSKFGKYFLEVERRFKVSRLGFVFLYCLMLSFVIFYQLRPQIDLRVGQVAPMDVTSPISFEMIDELTTEEKRMRAQNIVAEVYDYDPDVFGRIVSSIDRAFRNMRAFGREVKWPRSVLRREESVRPFMAQKAAFEKDLRTSVPDDIYDWLIDNKFAPKIENALVRALDNWYDHKIAELPDRNTSGSELTVRALGRNSAGAESRLRLSEVMDLRNPELFVLETKGLDKFSDADKAHLGRLSRALVQPNLTVNKAETSARKQKARDEVLAVNVSIKKNQVIVSKGSAVQPFHMAINKQVENLQAGRREGQMMLALAFLLTTAILVFASFQRRYNPQKSRMESKDLMVMMLLVLVQVLGVKIYLFVADALLMSRYSASFSYEALLAMAPVMVAPMLIGLLIGRAEIIWFFSAFAALCLGIMNDFNLPFFFQALVSGIAAARGVFGCKTRNDVYTAGLRAGGVNVIIISCLHLITRFDHGLGPSGFFTVVAAGFFGGILSSLITMMIVPLLESAFNYTTDVKLLELSNLNHPLMKEMIVKAPGTYHHSIMVGSMVEAAAEEIGANPLLGKVMSYYHDIGKLEHSNYFIENQRPGHNPHEGISPFMSKTLLIAHVKDGMEMGMRHKLGKPIIDGILQHHGTTLISYFYHKALEQRQEGDPEISEADFRYPGPKPQFKEAALCMLADSIEAAVRSLDEPTPARMQAIVKNIIQKKFSDGQLDECNLTLKEVAKIELAFTRILFGVYHQRIDYPRGVS